MMSVRIRRLDEPLHLLQINFVHHDYTKNHLWSFTYHPGIFLPANAGHPKHRWTR